MIDHVTVHVPAGTLDGDEIASFMGLVGLREIRPNDPLYGHDLKVRWFRQLKIGNVMSTDLHLVETDDGEHDKLALGHICVRMSKARIRELAETHFCVRDSGSGRIWLTFANIRVEVRP